MDEKDTTQVESHTHAYAQRARRKPNQSIQTMKGKENDIDTYPSLEFVDINFGWPFVMEYDRRQQCTN